MEPEEKAIELVNNYYNSIYDYVKKHKDGVLEQAKYCALIAVNNIIASNPHSNLFNTEVYSTISYWQQVKQEIEKI
jgi:hypothetical protein